MLDLLVEGDALRTHGDRRGEAVRIVLPGGKAVYVRTCLRGGAMRRLLRDRYFLRPERPLRELVVTEMARSVGLPVPQVLAVAIEEKTFGYRGRVVTEEIEGAEPLIDVYRRTPGEMERRRVLQRVGAAIRRMHDAGVYHVDLTGANVLLKEQDEIAFVDFDRAFVSSANHSRYSRSGVERFFRSMRKLCGDASPPFAAADEAALRQGYDCVQRDTP